MSVFYPMLAMMGLTLFCIMRLGYLRFVAVKEREVDPRFFSLYRGYDEPEKLAVCSRHVVNLFEAPVLFYVLGITAFLTEQSGSIIIGLAWVYVGLRFVHSYVHLTNNVVIIRFRLFVISMIVLMVLWAVVLIGIIRS
jgi:hypothetical protein